MLHGSINTEFDKQMSGGLYYYQQILVASACIVFLVFAVLFFILKDIDNYPIYIKNQKKYEKQIKHIKHICLSLSDRMLIFFIVIPLLLCILVLSGQKFYLSSTDFKLILVIFILSTLTISLVNIYIRKELSNILIELKNTSFSDTKRTNISTKLSLQILPVIAVCIVFTYLAISTIYEKNNANTLSNYYTNQFKNSTNEKTFYTNEDLINVLNKISLHDNTDLLFIMDNSFNFTYQTGELSDFFKSYAAKLSISHNNKVFDYYGVSKQGIIFPITLNNGETYYLGASYIIYSNETVSYIVYILLGLAVLCSIILRAYARELSKNIENVNKSLKKIANDNQNFSGEKLYVTSVDEIGDLIVSFNKISDITAEHLNKIKNNQDMLMERERLASLGQLIGGIAHNLKTPIMSIAGADEGISDLVKELDASIGNPVVNDDDFHAIAKDMNDWIEKIKSYTSYMSDILTAVKGQAVTFSDQENENFTVSELFKRVDILMKHELKQAIVYLNISLKIPENTLIYGNVNSLVQVINNMISNSIQAYGGKPDQKIELIAEKDLDNHIIISVKDYGPGLPNVVKEKLFNEMVTTKGKNGTGLGLYMSYSTIKAHFNGDIKVETSKCGTTFNIILPLR